MEALRKIVPGSVLEPLFSLPCSAGESQYEVIVLPFAADNDPGDATERKSLAASLCGTLGDVDFDYKRELTPERGSAVELFT
jgi:hypothetical protein